MSWKCRSEMKSRQKAPRELNSKRLSPKLIWPQKGARPSSSFATEGGQKAQNVKDEHSNTNQMCAR